MTIRIALALGILFFQLSGCGMTRPVGTVSGSVSIDGKTVEDGLIRFIPVDGDSQPNDSRIINGAYSVTMPIGEKRVEIFWYKATGPAEDTATQGMAKGVQMVPAKFNVESTLTYTIVKGQQNHDFSLSSR